MSSADTPQPAGDPAHQFATSSAPHNQDQDPILVGAADLPVYCPGPKAPLWSQHPRVYIEVAKMGVAQCQYCGARYALEPGAKVHGH